MGGVPRAGWVVCALLVAAAVVVEVTTSDADLAEVVYLAVLVAAGGAAWAGVRRWPRAERQVPRLIAVGVTLNAAAELCWSALDHAGVDTDVSVADLAWFASYAVLGAALWAVLRRSRPGGRVDADFLVDAVTIVVISVLVFWRSSVSAIIADDSLTPLVRTVWATYPVMDAVLLALVVRLLASRRGRRAVEAWFAAGVCLWLLADVLYLHVTEGPLATPVMNACWMVAPVLLAAAAWRPTTAEPVTADPAAPTRTAAQLAIAVGPLIVPAALEAYADAQGQDDHLGQLLAGTAALMVLALVRTSRLIRSEQRALHELEAARDAAVAASQAKSMFVANVSHEIRTPLTAVLAAAELMTTTPLDDTQRTLVDRLRRSGQHLLSLVTEMLDFSKLEAGRTQVELTDFDLRGVLADVLETHRRPAAEQDTELVHDVRDGVPPLLRGDRTKVRQVLSNLIGNAVKFTAGGRVTVVVEPLADGVRLCVSDTGVGIAAKDQALVFESFRQVDGSASRRYGGTGLGLAICKELVELMGGTISLRSAPGAGSTFTVELPMAAVRDDQEGLVSQSVAR